MERYDMIDGLVSWYIEELRSLTYEQLMEDYAEMVEERDGPDEEE